MNILGTLNSNFLKMNKKNWFTICIVVAVVVLVVAAISIWQILPESKTPSSSSPLVATSSPFSSPVDETTDWHVYTNDEYSYQIKYPKNWGTIKCLESIIFAPEDAIKTLEQAKCAVGGGKGLTLTINYRTKEQYEEIILPNRKTDENKIVALKSVIIDGIESKHYTTECLTGIAGTNIEKGDILTDILVPYEDGYLEITLLDNQYLEIYNQMTSTFKFID